MSMFQRQGGTCHWENPGDGKPQGGKNKENQESAALSEASERSRLWRSAVRPGGRPRLISYSLSSSNHLHSPPRYYPPDHHPSHQGAVDTLAGLATHVLQRTVLTSIPLLRVKAQNDSMAEEERSPNHDVPDWPFPTVINDEVKSH